MNVIQKYINQSGHGTLHLQGALWIQNAATVPRPPVSCCHGDACEIPHTVAPSDTTLIAFRLSVSLCRGREEHRLIKRGHRRCSSEAVDSRRVPNVNTSMFMARRMGKYSAPDFPTFIFSLRIKRVDDNAYFPPLSICPTAHWLTSRGAEAKICKDSKWLSTRLHQVPTRISSSTGSFPGE